jgi:ectoine hydroxylase-related dioxygenase (phytanoyl-CoA dioxygenase family)
VPGTVDTAYSKEVREFEKQGFLIIPEALAAEQIAALNQAIDNDRQTFPDGWLQFNEALAETPDILARTSEFDFVIENPLALGFLRRLIGEDITFEEFLAMIREPTQRPQDFKGWHRDLIRDYDRRHEIEYVSVIYYLTDVTEDDHCFSIVPETHARLVDLRPEEIIEGSEVDVIGPAGTALVFHGRAIHCGKHKPNSRQRRTVHISYWRAGRPRAQEWTSIPPRLYQRKDSALPPQLYSKYNVTDVVDGVGRKPRDIDPNLPINEIIREVHRRASKRL